MTEQELHPYVEWIVREARRPVALDAEPRARLMAAIRAETPPRRPSRLAWTVRRHAVSLSPLASLALAAGLVGIGVLAGWYATRRSGPIAARDPFVAAVPARLPVHDTVRVIKFVLVAPQASQVSLVGDFNSWDTKATPMARTPTGGTWSVAVQLPEGRHLYAFVVDGKEWLADPAAPLAPVDGYGVPNSVVVVGGGKGRATS